MSMSRRDFVKLLGVSVASLLLTRCRGILPNPTPSCYEPVVPPTPVHPLQATSIRENLRLLWLRFPELARHTLNSNNSENDLGQEMIAAHRVELDELVKLGDLSEPVAALVQEAYEAAVFHVWRSNVPSTCYAPVLVDYGPASADVLVKQSELLGKIAAQGTIDPATLAKARTALEQDLAFYALSDSDVQVLYGHLLAESQASGQPIPSFDALQLELNPEARSAAQFILGLMTTP